MILIIIITFRGKPSHLPLSDLSLRFQDYISLVNQLSSKEIVPLETVDSHICDHLFLERTNRKVCMMDKTLNTQPKVGAQSDTSE